MQNPLNNYLNYPAKKKLHILKKTTFCDVVKQKKKFLKTQQTRGGGRNEDDLSSLIYQFE